MAIRTISSSRHLVRDFGTCLKFSSATDIINLGTGNPFGIDFFFAGWVKWNGLNGNFQSIFAKRDSYASNQLMFDFNIVNTTGKLTVDTITSFVQFGVTLPFNKWTHIIWVHDNSAGAERLYINGVLVSTQGVATMGTGTTANVTVGGDQNPGEQNFNGMMDEIFVGKYIPTTAQVEDIYYRSIYTLTNSWTYLKLDEGSGTTATDSSGNGNNGTITGATYSSDVFMKPRVAVSNRITVRDFGTCLYFPGNSYVDMGDILKMFYSGVATISAWIKPRRLNFSGAIVSKQTRASPFTGYGFYFNSGGKLHFEFINVNGSSDFKADTTNVVINETVNWHHVVAVYNNRTVAIYVDGISVPVTVTSNTVNATPAYTHHFNIGGRNNDDGAGDNDYFGLIDEVQYYDADALTAAQVLALRTSGFSGISPKGYWKLDEGTGSSTADSSGNGFTGTITGATWSTDVFMKPRTSV